MARVFGAKVHADRLRRMERIEPGLVRAVEAGAYLIANEAKRSIISGSVSGPGHVPSRPGEPPNADTHDLDESIHVVVNRSRAVASVVADSEHALPMEYGTSTVEPRPFMGPASRKMRPEARKLVARAVSQTVKGS